MGEGAVHVQSSLTILASGGSAATAEDAGVQHCLALRGSPTRPVRAIPEISAMAQSSSHMSFACLQMPDELSALIQGIVRERVRRN